MNTTNFICRVLIFAIVIFGLCSCTENQVPSTIRIYKAPTGEKLSKLCKVFIEKVETPVYEAKVAPANDADRWRAMDDKTNSAYFHEFAAFTYFDMKDTAQIKIVYPEKVSFAKIVPESAGIKPIVEGNTVSFTIHEPKPLTVEINGDWIHSLHLFANPFETNIPDPNDPNVIYFAPGIHEISHLEVGDNQTVYIAGGAIVRAVIKPNEDYKISSYSGLKTYSPSISLKGKNIKICGRGIIDASACTTHARNMIAAEGENIQIEGIILRDPSTWTVPIRKSKNVDINNLKLIGYRANSDGIDICNSFDVTIRNCFLRTLDDLIVIKTPDHKGESGRIKALQCVLWNACAHALSLGAEITNTIEDILFKDCDIIHDEGRNWALRIYQSDGALVHNIRFEDIRIEQTRKFASLWIGEAVWSKDKTRGNIRNIVFKDIDVKGSPLNIDFIGFDNEHKIDSVLIQNVILNGHPISEKHIHSNDFVENIIID